MDVWIGGFVDKYIVCGLNVEWFFNFGVRSYYEMDENEGWYGSWEDGVYDFVSWFEFIYLFSNFKFGLLELRLGFDVFLFFFIIVFFEGRFWEVMMLIFEY